MTKKEKISFAEILENTYDAIEKVNPNFASNFHFNKKGQIVLDDAYIVAYNGKDYLPCDNEKFIDFITNNKGEIEFYIRFNNSGIDLNVETFSL